MTPAKTVLAVHDLSCVGRCALTVAIPALASSGLQPIPLPTAVLSTHTGGFTDMACRRLTDFMAETDRHWQSMNLQFDAIYTGYLADPAQGELLIGLIERARKEKNVFVLVDPAMGDEGELYQGLDPAMPRIMGELCRLADLATPNITEAFLLCGEKPRDRLESVEEALPLFEGIGAKQCVITGAHVGDRSMNLWKNGCVVYEPCEGFYPGAGDLFSSVLLGRVMRGEALPDAVKFTSEYLSMVVYDTWKMGTESRMGLQFERKLHVLA